MPVDHPTPKQRDERVAIPADFEEALRAALAVDPESEPVEVDDDAAPEGA